MSDIRTGDEWIIGAPEGTLTDDQKLILQKGEWDKRPLSMQINIIEVGKKVKSATLVKVGLSDADKISVVL